MLFDTSFTLHFFLIQYVINIILKGYNIIFPEKINITVHKTELINAMTFPNLLGNTFIQAIMLIIYTIRNAVLGILINTFNSHENI